MTDAAGITATKALAEVTTTAISQQVQCAVLAEAMLGVQTRTMPQETHMEMAVNGIMATKARVETSTTQTSKQVRCAALVLLMEVVTVKTVKKLADAQT